jgi:hypothetical protein
MNSKLSNIKNIAWAIAIVVSLVLLLVALGFAAFTRHHGELERPTVLMGEAAEKRDAALAEKKAAEEKTQQQQSGPGEVYLLGESGDAGQAYIDSLTFLCDSALIGLRDYGLLREGTATTQVWGSSAGNIPASQLGSFKIRFPGDGSEVSPADAAMIAKPSILVISLGTDGLADSNETQFISDFEALIRGVQEASPYTTVVVCTITSVTISYSGSDGLEFTLVNRANEWLARVCADTGAYLVDAASAVSDSNGSLLTEYASANGKTLNSAGLSQILLYLRNHALAF